MVNDAPNKVRESGNGSKTDFDFAFKYFNDTDVKVYKIDTSVTPEVATLQVLNTDYTLTSSSPQGGTVRYAVAPTSDEDSFIYPEAALTQEVDIPAAGAFREEAIENGLDKTVMLCQQLNAKIDRSILLPATTDITSLTFDDPVDGRALKFRDDGSGAWTIEASTSDPDSASAYADAAAASAVTAAASASDAQTAQGLAEDAQAAAEAAAALMPDPTGNGLELLRANSGGTANEYSGVTISTDGTFASNSDAKVPTEKAVVTYVAANNGDTYVELSSEHSLSVSWNSGSWVDVSVSSYVPTGAKAVRIRAAFQDASTLTEHGFRKNGSSVVGPYNRVSASGITHYIEGRVELDSSRVFEAYTNTNSATARYVFLCGYWI